MDWFVVDREYIEYLLKYDSKVGYVDYGEKLKLHLGILLKVNSCDYYIPISSAKPKHLRMSNSIDFHKIQDEKTGELYSVINLNNMIPVPEKCVRQLKYNKVTTCRSVSSELEKTNYIYLLQKEKSIIDNIANVLQEKAMKLYDKVKEFPGSKLAQRCCNFKLLKSKSKDYKKEG